MSDVSDLKAELLVLKAENAELRKHVRMPDEPLEIDEKDFYVRAFIKWATEEQPEVKRLEAENEKLRRERDFYFQQVTENGERAHGAIDTLNAENAKLLELLRPLVDFADFECNLMYDCTACQMGSGERQCYLVKALRYLHELGVDA